MELGNTGGWTHDLQGNKVLSFGVKAKSLQEFDKQKKSMVY